MVTQAQGRTAWLGLCPWSLAQEGVPEHLGRSHTGLLCPIRGSGSGPYLPGCAGLQPGSLTGSQRALLAVGTGSSGGADARRVGRDRLLDPEGRGACKMKA